MHSVSLLIYNLTSLFPRGFNVAKSAVQILAYTFSFSIILLLLLAGVREWGIVPACALYYNSAITT